MLLLLLIVAVNVTGCGSKGMSKADRDAAIQQRLEEIERIKSDPTMKPQVKQDLIERSQLQIDQLRDEKTDSK
ncbi:MAG TPA: hypothetical protein VNQ76_15650 [Planctomicrobium sp.]|nr:hypothetical protein [Planctomicrobium sp.]